MCVAHRLEQTCARDSGADERLDVAGRSKTHRAFPHISDHDWLWSFLSQRCDSFKQPMELSSIPWIVPVVTEGLSYPKTVFPQDVLKISLELFENDKQILFAPPCLALNIIKPLVFNYF